LNLIKEIKQELANLQKVEENNTHIDDECWNFFFVAKPKPTRVNKFITMTPQKKRKNNCPKGERTIHQEDKY
jgi:hypothetical protein